MLKVNTYRTQLACTPCCGSPPFLQNTCELLLTFDLHEGKKDRSLSCKCIILIFSYFFRYTHYICNIFILYPGGLSCIIYFGDQCTIQQCCHLKTHSQYLEKAKWELFCGHKYTHTQNYTISDAMSIRKWIQVGQTWTASLWDNEPRWKSRVKKPWIRTNTCSAERNPEGTKTKIKRKMV